MAEAGIGGSSDNEDLLLHSEQTSQPCFRPGRRLVVLGAVSSAAALVTVCVLGAVGLLQPNEEAGFFPRGVERTASIDAVVELISSQQYSDMLDLVNKERQKNGLSDLCYNEKLNAAARDHSRDMARHKKMSHTGSDGSGPSQRVTKAGYRWNMVAENVAAGQTSVAQVMEDWMNSPGHKANILRKGISHFGFGLKDQYWTQVFASPMGDESCMLVGGGEDGHGGRCRDVVPPGETRWHDSDGKGYHCDWYAAGDHCKQHGHSYKNFGYTATQACCACGGGGGAGGCLDKTTSSGGEWYDSGGKEYHCDWYGAKASRCSTYGDQYKNHGMTAKQACCTCGGGTNMADKPEPAPAPPPPSNTGLCCYKDCQSSSDCRQPNLFCCPHHKLCMDKTTLSTAGPNCDACSR